MNSCFTSIHIDRAELYLLWGCHTNGKLLFAVFIDGFFFLFLHELLGMLFPVEYRILLWISIFNTEYAVAPAALEDAISLPVEVVLGFHLIIVLELFLYLHQLFPSLFRASQCRQIMHQFILCLFEVRNSLCLHKFHMALAFSFEMQGSILHSFLEGLNGLSFLQRVRAIVNIHIGCLSRVLSVHTDKSYAWADNAWGHCVSFFTGSGLIICPECWCLCTAV